ncbi:MAG: collagen-like protein, partial [Lachnospiraceae bacterium]|nr:collagen-like protein [Lachnospiraceae bacterium]
MLNLVVNRDKIKETYLSANDTEFKIIFNSSDWYRMHKKAIFLVGGNSYIVEGLENNRIYSLPEECAGTEFSVYIVGESSNSYKSTEKQLIRILGGEVSNLEVQAAVEKYLERNPVSGVTEEQRMQLAKIPELENTIKDLEKQTGVGIQSISKTATNGLIDTYTIEFTDDTTTTFQVKNGEKGEPGIQGARGEPGKNGENGERGR